MNDDTAQQMTNRIKQILHLVLACGVLLFASCKSPRLFQNDYPKATSYQEFMAKTAEPSTLRAGDKITISIFGHDKLSIGSINSIYTTEENTGRWIVLDDEGEVNIPKVGRVKLTGLNLKEAAYFLEQKYRLHLQDPVINVKVLNHFITVLGEVNMPGKYRIDNEKVNIAELLGEAGGMTKYADFSQIQLIRQYNGLPLSVEVDFSRFQSLAGQNAILQPDDIVYIPPGRKKQADENLNKALPISGILTGIAVLFSVFIK